ncbi:MAG: hypothetical protein GY719_24745 [bacterium]|nr:hypothetical protein [bacterium]
MDESSRYRRAGAIYFVLGVVIMAITVLSPGLASPERRGDVVHLLVGLPFFGLFALVIAYGDRVLGSWLRQKITMLLTLSALGRVFIFAANGIGWQPGISWRPVAVAFQSVEPTPRMLVNAVLMAVIVVVLFRASWLPFLRRFRRDAED